MLLEFCFPSSSTLKCCRSNRQMQLEFAGVAQSDRINTCNVKVGRVAQSGQIQHAQTTQFDRMAETDQTNTCNNVQNEQTSPEPSVALQFKVKFDLGPQERAQRFVHFTHSAHDPRARNEVVSGSRQTVGVHQRYPRPAVSSATLAHGGLWLSLKKT